MVDLRGDDKKRSSRMMQVPQARKRTVGLDPNVLTRTYCGTGRPMCWVSPAARASPPPRNMQPSRQGIWIGWLTPRTKGLSRCAAFWRAGRRKTSLHRPGTMIFATRTWCFACRPDSPFCMTAPPPRSCGARSALKGSLTRRLSCHGRCGTRGAAAPVDQGRLGGAILGCQPDLVQPRRLNVLWPRTGRQRPRVRGRRLHLYQWIYPRPQLSYFPGGTPPRGADRNYAPAQMVRDAR